MTVHSSEEQDASAAATDDVAAEKRERRWPRRARRILVGALVATTLLVLVVWRAVRIDFPCESVPALSAKLATPEREKELLERANDLLDRYVAASGFSGVVLIAVGDDVRLERAFGVQDGPNTRLTFGSVPKQFTGYVIQRLAERGQLRLDQEVGDLVPELRDAPVGRATVHHLLYMTSGLPDSVDLITNVRIQFSRDWMSEAELLQKIRGYPLAFPPGSDFLYSNVGYRLLAILASRVSHHDWPALLREHVFEPAGLGSAGVFAPNEPPPSDIPPGHLPYRCWLLAGRPCMLQLPHWNYSALWGAGAVYSRSRDWLAWSRFLKRIATDDPAFFAAYSAPDREDYASGIENKELTTPDGERVRVLFKGGEDPGYGGYFVWIPGLDITMVWLSNTDYGFTSNYELGRELRALVAGLPYQVVAR